MLAASRSTRAPVAAARIRFPRSVGPFALTPAPVRFGRSVVVVTWNAVTRPK